MQFARTNWQVGFVLTITQPAMPPMACDASGQARPADAATARGAEKRHGLVAGQRPGATRASATTAAPATAGRLALTGP